MWKNILQGATLAPLLCLSHAQNGGECPSGVPGPNEVGKCECNNQFFLSEDCRSSYFCTDTFGDGEEDGCALDCPEGQVVQFVPAGSATTWECADEAEAGDCIGGYTSECDADNQECPAGYSSPNPLGNCECNNQFFLSEDCSSSFFCTDVFGEDEGCLLECPEGQVVQFVPAGSETTWECVEQNGQLCVGDLSTNC